MSFISLGLSNTSIPPETSDSVIVIGLTGGTAAPGDLLSASLSSGTLAQSYAWGSTATASDYGSEPTLIVPAAAADSILYVTIGTLSQTYTTTVSVDPAPAAQNTILTDTDTILVQSLEPLTAPALSVSAGTEAIILENI